MLYVSFALSQGAIPIYSSKGSESFGNRKIKKRIVREIPGQAQNDGGPSTGPSTGSGTARASTQLGALFVICLVFR